MTFSNRLILFLLFFSLVSCTQQLKNETPIPDNLIPRETMIDIILDMHLYDAIVSIHQKKSAKNNVKRSVHIHNSILEKYSITREQFELSYNYYQNELKIIDELYAKAITELNKMKMEQEQEDAN